MLAAKIYSEDSVQQFAGTIAVNPGFKSERATSRQEASILKVQSQRSLAWRCEMNSNYPQMTSSAISELMLKTTSGQSLTFVCKLSRRRIGQVNFPFTFSCVQKTEFLMQWISVLTSKKDNHVTWKGFESVQVIKMVLPHFNLKVHCETINVESRWQ